MSLEWSIRGLLNPVITRLLIYGVNPIDVEYVLSAVEAKDHANTRSLEQTWLAEWEQKALRYKDLAEQAVRGKHLLSARELFLYAAQCYYAIFLINLSSIEHKRKIYLQYADLYRKSIKHYDSPVEYLEIPLEDGVIAGYLHLPPQSATGRVPCVVIFSGLGSCKEEMHILARPLVERGMAAFVPDMPGSGETLFSNHVPCRQQRLDAAFVRILDALEARADLTKGAFGAYGLCMGGGYAHRAACIDPRYTFCVTLFALFITHVADGATPQWMKQGDWYNLQTGGLPGAEFLQEMRALANGALACPYLFIHGQHDNWMTLDVAMELFNKAQAEKEKIIIEELPVFSSQQLVTHTMPVGEQLHWLKHVAADWMGRHVP